MAAGVERASPTTEPEQARAVYAALDARDFAALEELAFSTWGFCSSDIRRVVWLFLLGLPPEQAVDAGWKQLLKEVDYERKEARVIHADVERSVYSWDKHAQLWDKARSYKRTQLSQVMHGILRRHNGKLSYFQGFHDIALVFLEVGTLSQAYHMMERLSLFHLTDHLCLPFDKGLTPVLGALFCLLQLLDEPLARALEEADCAELHFAVPWVLTWFAHSLPHLHQQVMRLFDCLIAGHPAMILYFSAALLLMHRDTIMQTERDLPEVVSVIQRLPLDSLDVDDWAARVWRLAQRVPPAELLRRLPPQRRQALPATSPLLNYPHPWMRKVTQATDKGAVVGTITDEDLLELAPIYAVRLDVGRAAGPPAVPAACLKSHSLRLAARAARLPLTLSFASVVLLVAWALARGAASWP